MVIRQAHEDGEFRELVELLFLEYLQCLLKTDQGIFKGLVCPWRKGLTKLNFANILERCCRESPKPLNGSLVSVHQVDLPVPIIPVVPVIRAIIGATLKAERSYSTGRTSECSRLLTRMSSRRSAGVMRR